MMLFGLNWGHTKEVVTTVKLQALVVMAVDKCFFFLFLLLLLFAQWISVDHTIRWMVIYPLESVAHLSNNQGLKF